MIQILLFILSALLLFIGYSLVKKTSIFLAFLKEKEGLDAVLIDYGKFFIVGGILGIVCAVFNDRFFNICFIIGVFILSGIFSFYLSKNIKMS